MKLAITTDTHYGFSNKTHEIHEKFLHKLNEACVSEGVSALIHCGDWISHSQHQLVRTFKMFRKSLGDLPIIGVLGNHDLWSLDYYKKSPKQRRYVKFPDGSPIPLIHQQQLEWALESNITLLGKERSDVIQDVEGNKVYIYGFNGWYGDASHPTNDDNYMPKVTESCPTDVYLRHKAFTELDWCLEDVSELVNTNAKKICVTHMPPYSFSESHLVYCANPRYMEFIGEKFDYMFVGHSHQTEDWIYDASNGNKCRVVNPGTLFDRYSHGYDHPNFVIVEV